MSTSIMRLLVQDLRRVGPGVLNGPTAAKVGVSVAVPLLVLMAVDRLEWSPFCAFGAFAAVYGRALNRRDRARQQAQAGVALVVAVTLGTVAALSAHPTSWIVLGGSLTAMVAAVVADVLEWKPGGGLFTLFGFAVCATQSDASWDTVLVALVLSAATATFATLVGCIGPAGSAVASRGRSLRTHLRDRSTVRHTVRHLVAPLLTGALAVAIGLGHPYWGMVASIVPLTSPSLREMLFRGVHRLVGTAIGLALTALILALDPGAAALVAVIIVAQVITELVVLRHYALALVFITPLALLMGELVHPLPTSDLVVQRGGETLIGVVIGLAVAWLTRRRPA